MKRLSIKNGASTLPSVSERFWVATWTLGVVAIIVLGCSPFGPPAPATRTPLSAAPSPTSTSTPTVIISPTPEPTSLPAATPVATPTTVSLVQATSLPMIPDGGIVYAVTPNVNQVGWVRSGEDGNHFGDSYIHVGFLGDNVYHGAIQFDIRFIPPGSSIHYAALELVGLSGETLGSGGSWHVRLLEEDIDADWPFHGYRAIHEVPVTQTLSPTLGISDLAENELNVFVFNSGQRAILESRLKGGSVSFRLDGPSSGADNLFTWDTGYGLGSLGKTPILRLAVTSSLLIPTSPAGTEIAARVPETPTPTFVIVTSTPTPETIFTAAAIAATVAYQATTVGTPTNTPSNWVTPNVVTSTPTPENEATATYMAAWSTAAAIATGTATPTPRHMWTATPTATPTPTPMPTNTPLSIPFPNPTMTPLPNATPTPDPAQIPSEWKGRIAFISDRDDGKVAYYIMDADGKNVEKLTGDYFYRAAAIRDTLSPDNQFQLVVAKYKGDTQINLLRLSDGVQKYLVGGEEGDDYAPAYCQAEPRYFAWTSSQLGSSRYGGLIEVFVADLLDSGPSQMRTTRMTQDTNGWEWDQHPSWSPDCKQIVFYSNRTGKNQIWIMDFWGMNFDGANQHPISDGNYNDWDPVWIK